MSTTATEKDATVPTPIAPLKALPSPQILEFLRSHTVQDLIDQRLPRKLHTSIEHFKDIKSEVNQFGRELISIDCTCKVDEVLRLLKEKGVTKVPVYKHVSDGGKNVFAIISVLDLLHYLAFQDAWGRLPADIREVSPEKMEEYKKTLQKNAALFDQPVEAVIGFNIESTKLVRLYMDDTAEKLFRALASVHEVLVTDREHETEEIYNTLITQSDALWYLLSNKSSMGDGTFDVPVEKVVFAMRRNQDIDPNQVIKPGITPRARFVLKAEESCSALVCFRMMRIHHLTSVALVDEYGKLVGNLSASDLINIGRENFGDICLPVMDFLKKYNKEPFSRIATIRPTDSLAKAMEIAIDEKIHRIYAVDENFAPVEIITMSDMLGFTMSIVPSEE